MKVDFKKVPRVYPKEGEGVEYEIAQSRPYLQNSSTSDIICLILLAHGYEHTWTFYR